MPHYTTRSWVAQSGVNEESKSTWIVPLAEHDTIDGSEIPNNHLGMVLQPCK